MTEPNTRERILDAAEHLFAHKGYHNTSLREITSRAVANLAAVNYYFGSKENLIEAVIERRLTPLNKIRLERLEELKANNSAAKGHFQVEDIMRAFIEPTIRFFESEKGIRNFSIIITRAHNDPDSTIRSLFLKKVQPLFLAFFETLCRTLPDVPKDLVFTRFLFAIGALSNAMMRIQHADDLFENLPDGVSRQIDAKALTERLIGFVTRGMEDS